MAEGTAPVDLKQQDTAVTLPALPPAELKPELPPKPAIASEAKLPPLPHPGTQSETPSSGTASADLQQKARCSDPLLCLFAAAQSAELFAALRHVLEPHCAASTADQNNAMRSAKDSIGQLHDFILRKQDDFIKRALDSIPDPVKREQFKLYLHELACQKQAHIIMPDRARPIEEAFVSCRERNAASGTPALTDALRAEFNELAAALLQDLTTLHEVRVMVEELRYAQIPHTKPLDDFCQQLFDAARRIDELRQSVLDALPPDQRQELSGQLAKLKDFGFPKPALPALAAPTPAQDHAAAFLFDEPLEPSKEPVPLGPPGTVSEQDLAAFAANLAHDPPARGTAMAAVPHAVVAPLRGQHGNEALQLTASLLGELENTAYNVERCTAEIERLKAAGEADRAAELEQGRNRLTASIFSILQKYQDQISAHQSNRVRSVLELLPDEERRTALEALEHLAPEDRDLVRAFTCDSRNSPEPFSLYLARYAGGDLAREKQPLEEGAQPMSGADAVLRLAQELRALYREELLINRLSALVFDCPDSGERLVQILREACTELQGNLQQERSRLSQPDLEQHLAYALARSANSAYSAPLAAAGFFTGVALEPPQTPERYPQCSAQLEPFAARFFVRDELRAIAGELRKESDFPKAKIAWAYCAVSDLERRLHERPGSDALCRELGALKETLLWRMECAVRTRAPESSHEILEALNDLEMAVDIEQAYTMLDAAYLEEDSRRANSQEARALAGANPHIPELRDFADFLEGKVGEHARQREAERQAARDKERELRRYTEEELAHFQKPPEDAALVLMQPRAASAETLAEAFAYDSVYSGNLRPYAQMYFTATRLQQLTDELDKTKEGVPDVERIAKVGDEVAALAAALQRKLDFEAELAAEGIPIGLSSRSTLLRLRSELASLAVTLNTEGISRDAAVYELDLLAHRVPAAYVVEIKAMPEHAREACAREASALFGNQQNSAEVRQFAAFHTGIEQGLRKPAVEKVTMSEG